MKTCTLNRITFFGELLMYKIMMRMINLYKLIIMYKFKFVCQIYWIKGMAWFKTICYWMVETWHCIEFDSNIKVPIVISLLTFVQSLKFPTHIIQIHWVLLRKPVWKWQCCHCILTHNCTWSIYIQWVPP